MLDICISPAISAPLILYLLLGITYGTKCLILSESLISRHSKALLDILSEIFIIRDMSNEANGCDCE